jgi:predicted transcriptional regulator
MARVVKMHNSLDYLEKSVMGWGNRGWIEIIEYILEVCQGDALKTHIMYKCNLNSKQVQQYVNFLLDRRLLEIKQSSIDSKRPIFKTTEKGERYIIAYKRLVDIFNS